MRHPNRDVLCKAIKQVVRQSAKPLKLEEIVRVVQRRYRTASVTEVDSAFWEMCVCKPPELELDKYFRSRIPRRKKKEG